MAGSVVCTQSVILARGDSGRPLGLKSWVGGKVRGSSSSLTVWAFCTHCHMQMKRTRADTSCIDRCVLLVFALSTLLRCASPMYPKPCLGLMQLDRHHKACGHYRVVTESKLHRGVAQSRGHKWLPQTASRQIVDITECTNQCQDCAFIGTKQAARCNASSSPHDVVHVFAVSIVHWTA